MHEVKTSQDNIIRANDPQKQLIIYTNRSGVNGKIGAAAVILLQNIALKAYLGPTHYFSVYSDELQAVAMTLNSNSFPNYQFTQKVTFFTDNHSVIQVISALNLQSEQLILRFIMLVINNFQEQHIDLELQYKPE